MIINLFQVGFMSVIILMLAWTILGTIDRIKAGQDLISMYGVVLLSNLIYLVLRILHFLDPYGIYGYIPGPLAVFSFWIGITITITTCALSISLWFDIAAGIDGLEHEGSSFACAKVVTIICGCLVFGISVFSLIFFYALGDFGSATAIINLVIIVSQLGMVAMSFCVIPKVSKIAEALKKKKLNRVYIVGVLLIVGIEAIKVIGDILWRICYSRYCIYCD